jgi:dipeptidyl aminopeptidase/acylaminoacyl peptidase
MCRTILAAVIMITLAAPSLRAEAPKADKAKGLAESAKWSIDDVILSETASDFQIAPDCRHVVWVKSAQDKDKGSSISNLMRSSLKDKDEIELTRGTESCFDPTWSPDGKLVAFLTARRDPKAKPSDDDDKRLAAGKEKEPTAQIWLINPFGGEPWPLTDGRRAVVSHAWADADTIIFAAQEDPTRLETRLKDDSKDDAQVVDDEANEPPVRLFKVTVKEKTVTRLTDNRDRIQSFRLSPDGRRAVAIHDRSLRYEFDHGIKPAVFLHDLANGERKRVFADRKFNISSIRWTRDGQGLYATNEYTSHPRFVHATITELYYYALTAAKPVKVDLGWANGLSSSSIEVTDDGFLALLAAGARNKAARFHRDGDQWRREWLTGDKVGNLFDLRIGKDNQTLLYTYSTASTPGQWHRAKLRGAELAAGTALTQLNPHLRTKTIARTEIVRWKGALDEEVEGILYYPHHYESGKKYPLVLMIHGGPAGADQDRWSESWSRAPNLMCQRGAFVLRPNYHGSSNYGLKFVESIANGKYYEYPLIDIEKGVDALIARGLVDPDKLGTLGWSNGAILSTALIVHSQRYKAASAGAGGAEWVGDWGACEFGMSFSNYYFGKSPLEDPQLYIKMAPLYQFGKVRTPTLLIHGTADRAVPVHDGWAQYRALQQHSKAKVRFVLLPGEAHSLSKLVHQRRKLEEELAWFDRHLFKTIKNDLAALKPDSPLAMALKLKGARRDGNRFGVIEKGVLIPETVKHQGLMIGRFEVTRAQYALFDKSYKFEPGTDNYPANCVTFEKAQAYCAWLSKQTGQTYRLPNADESNTLYEGTSAAENTLDYWAGYAVNPEDSARLRDKIKELGGAAPLLKEVGSFKGAGKEEFVFDLGGNVAEWTVAKDGKGKIMGGSADLPADPKLGKRQPAAEYIGFRVVKP